MISELTQERLKELLHYDPNRGIWTWLIQTRRAQTKIGDLAGYIDLRRKNRWIRIDQKLYSVGPLCFLYMTGEWPRHRVINKGKDHGIHKWHDLGKPKDRKPKGLKRSPAKSEEERLQRKRDSFKKWYEKNGPRPWTPVRGVMRAAGTSRYRKRYPERVLVQKNARRTRELGAIGHHTEFDLHDILKSQKNKCAYCRVKLSNKNKNLDHIEALAKGGTNDRKNLQYLCGTCNRRKSAKDPLVFAQQRGMLL